MGTRVGGGGGVVGEGKKMADKLSQAVNRVPQGFWSGGLDRQAEKLAKSVGGKSLEMTRLGQVLTSIEAKESAWNAASANFANIARGVAYSLQNSAGVRIASVWATVEFPILIQSNVQIVFQTFYQQLFK